MWLDTTNYIGAVKAVLDYVKSDDRIGNKIALYGISYGGFLATQAACEFNDDICGLIVRGGTDRSDDLTKHPWMGIPNFYLGGFQLKFNQEDLEICSKMSTEMCVTDKLSNITVPTLIIHTKEDPIIGVEGAKRIYNMISSEDKYYAEYPGNAHCVNDQMNSANCFGADWMVKRMLNK